MSNHTVIYSSDWPEIKVTSVQAAFDCGHDFTEWENGTLSADTFQQRWGKHPEADWSIVVDLTT